MAQQAEKRFRITYATMSADNDELHQAYERGVDTAKSWLGEKHPYYVNGEAREGEAYDEDVLALLGAGPQRSTISIFCQIATISGGFC